MQNLKDIEGMSIRSEDGHMSGSSNMKIGDKVTFQAYKGNDPLKVEILKITIGHMFLPNDDRTFYHLGYINDKGFPCVTNITTDSSIMESPNFNPV